MGFLSTVSANIRKYIDEPEASVKYSDSKLREYIRLAWNEILGELNKVSDSKVRVRIDLTIVADQREYELPPTIQEILSLEKIDTATGRPLWEVVSNHPLTPYGPGFTVEGPMIRFDPVWKEAETLRLTYVPNGDVEVYEGTPSAATSTTVTLPATGTGTLDKRPQAYTGYILRLTGATYSGGYDLVQERVVSAYNNQTRVCTFAPALSPVPTAVTSATFELVPQAAYSCEHAIALRVARLIAASTKDKHREASLNSEYHQVLRTLRMNLSRINARSGRQFKRAIRGKNSRGGW